MRSENGFRRSIVMCLCFALLAAPGGTAEGADVMSSPVVGWVEIVPASEGSDRVTIVGHAYGLATAAGRFTLAVKREGKSGSAKTGQSGSFNVTAGQNAVLARTAVDAAPSSAILIELKLLIGGKEVYSVVMKPSGDSSGREL